VGLFVRRLLGSLCVVVLCGSFLASGFHCVCARAAGCICCILEVVILLFSVVLDSGLCA